MKCVELLFEITDDLIIKSIIVQMNDTGIDDIEILKAIAKNIIIELNMIESANKAKLLINKIK